MGTCLNLPIIEQNGFHPTISRIAFLTRMLCLSSAHGEYYDISEKAGLGATEWRDA